MIISMEKLISEVLFQSTAGRWHTGVNGVSITRISDDNGS